MIIKRVTIENKEKEKDIRQQTSRPHYQEREGHARRNRDQGYGRSDRVCQCLGGTTLSRSRSLSAGLWKEVLLVLIF